MHRSTWPWGWGIRVPGASLVWLLPVRGMAGTSDRFAALGITPIEPPREAARPGAGGKQR
jgi:hypothetical protein